MPWKSFNGQVRTFLYWLYLNWMNIFIYAFRWFKNWPFNFQNIFLILQENCDSKWSSRLRFAIENRHVGKILIDSSILISVSMNKLVQYLPYSNRRTLAKKLQILLLISGVHSKHRYSKSRSSREAPNSSSKGFEGSIEGSGDG